MPDRELDTLYDVLTGSCLRLRVSAPPMPAGQRLHATARVYRSGQRIADWADADLQPGPALSALAQEGTYRVELDLQFPDRDHPPVTVHLDLLQPGGGIVASDFATVGAQTEPFSLRARVVVDDY